jgi:hypothetical protein
MHRARTLDEIHAELAGEHREIMGLVARLESGCSARELPGVLKTLHDSLVDHFAREQFPGGLYEALGACEPAYHEDLRVLVREHCSLLSSARGLLERSHHVAPRDWPGLLEDVAALAAALHAHEHREHRLVEKLKAAQAGTRAG